MGAGASAADHELIRELYAAYNRRDIDAVLEHVRDDVVWSNSVTGGELYGRAAVRAYWLRQLEQVQTFIEPQSIRGGRDRTYTIRVHQVSEAADRSEVLFDAVITQSITVGDDGRVSRFRAV